MERYNSYKDSGVEWIGEIPSHWIKSKLKFVSEIVTGNTPPTKDEDNYEGGEYLWVKPNEINGLTPTNDTNQKLTEKGKSLSRVLPPFSVLVNGIGRIGEFGYSEMSVSTNQQINSIVYNHKVDKRYGLFHTSMMKEGFISNSEKVVVPILNKTKQENIEFVIPPLSEQQQIVSFLDTKTSLIDSLIEKTQLKIELLKEKRISLINEVVTKGLNPNVEMKDSGVEWIGEIPSHYQIGKLKHLCNENQRSLSNSTDPNYELNYIEISDVNSEGVIGNPTPYIFSESPSRCRRIVQKGDVIVSTVRTYLKSIGLIEEEVEDLICSTGFSVLTPNNEINSKYLFYLLRTEWFISMVISKSEGVSYPSIQSEKLMNIDVVYCELSEQQQIVEYLDEQTQLIDRTITIEEKRIELLKEYRQSLISEVVTGKRKVVE